MFPLFKKVYCETYNSIHAVYSIEIKKGKCINYRNIFTPLLLHIPIALYCKKYVMIKIAFVILNRYPTIVEEEERKRRNLFTHISTLQYIKYLSARMNLIHSSERGLIHPLNFDPPISVSPP